MCFVFLMLAAATDTVVNHRLTFPLPENAKIIAAPSETQVAIVAKYETSIYVLDRAQNEWQAFTAAVGATGRREAPVPRDVGWKGMGWIVIGDREIFMPNRGMSEGLEIVNDRIDVVSAAAETAIAPFALGVAKLPDVWSRRPEEYSGYITHAYEVLKGNAERLRQQRSVQMQAPLPEQLSDLQDIAPDNTRVLCQVGEDEPLVGLDLLTGEVTQFVIQERPRTLPGDASGSFSPDGQYVLVQYNYHPDDHYGGGYLQLFTSGGEFVEELGAVPEGLASRVAVQDWLSNGWIVYGDGKTLRFIRLAVGGP